MAKGSLCGLMPRVDADVGRVPVIDAALRNGRRLFTAIPYHLWDNRAAGRMSVWLPERRNENRLYSVG